MRNKLFSIKAPILIIAFIAAFAQSPEDKSQLSNPKSTEILDEDLKTLLEKSKKRMTQANSIVKHIDKISSEHVSEMKESIKSLEEVNKQLTTEIYEIKSSAAPTDTTESTSFNLEPISDSKD